MSGVQRRAVVGAIVGLALSCGDPSDPGDGEGTELVGVWDASLSEIAGVDGSGNAAACTVQWAMAISDEDPGSARALVTNIPRSARIRCGAGAPAQWSQAGRHLSIQETGSEIVFRTTSAEPFIVAERGGEDALTGQAEDVLYPGARFAATRRDSPDDPNLDPYEVEASAAFRDVDVSDSSVATARTLDAYGNEIGGVTLAWSSSDPDIATVSALGVVHGITPGAMTITAAAGALQDTLQMEVLVPPATIEIVEAPDSIIAAESWNVTAVARNAGGQILTGRRFRWSSSDPAVATISDLGLSAEVTGVGPGTVTITARAATVTGSTTIPVLPAVNFVDVQGSLSVPIGGSVQLTATPQDNQGNPLAGRPVAWESDRTDILSVDETGLITGHQGGQAVITAQAGGVSTSLTFFAQMDGELTSVTAGDEHTCGRSQAGTIYCWGNGAIGQLGAGHVVLRRTAVPIPSEEVFAQVEAGTAHTCALNLAGAAFCWGANVSGQLGQPPGVPGEVEAVSGGRTFTALSAGGGYTCGLTAGEDIYCWGGNTWGELGRGASDDGVNPTPAIVIGGHDFIGVEAGPEHACGLTTAGHAYCWGSNRTGALGLGSVDDDPHPTPARAAAPLTFTALAAGAVRTCGIASDGVLYCWGEDELEPTQVNAADGWVQVVGRNRHFCAIDNSDQLTCFGEIQDHNLDHEPTTAALQVTTGFVHTCMLTGVGVDCWGRNDVWQLGTEDPTTGPVHVAGQRE